MPKKLSFKIPLKIIRFLKNFMTASQNQAKRQITHKNKLKINLKLIIFFFHIVPSQEEENKENVSNNKAFSFGTFIILL